MARLAGALGALVLAILLGWTAFATFFGDANVVLPTGRVSDGGPVDDLPAGPTAADVLAERSRLQEWRGESGPAPGEPADTTGEPALLEGDRDTWADPREIFRDWVALPGLDAELVRSEDFVEGVVAYPDPRGRVLVQPAGRDWRRIHNEEVTYGGGWVIFGFSLLLALFLAIRGRVPVVEGFSGRKVKRFNGFERANHWVTSISFLLMALTGLVLLYGQHFIKPLIGAGAYGEFALITAWVHMVFVPPFVVGALIMAVMWLGGNLPSRLDWVWLKQGGGFMRDDGPHPPARRFNAGQKLIFWAVMGGGAVLLLSGASLMFPFFWLDIEGMQWVQVIHAAMGLIMVAVIIGHIYIGTIGMEGAFDAMWSGEVDRNWAKEHHSIWLAEKEGRRADAHDEIQAATR
ncbi:MAG: formate dehydrogenase subunit gamma [Geminicoccaceae bacterium]|nr:formate dehydrogenase subunit gamma [Geminicoccaceae bacterium]